MSYKSMQLSPQASADKTSMRFLIQGPWGAPPSSLKDVQFLRSWLEYDSDGDATSRNHINWGAVSGISLALGVSAAFWAGVGLIIARIWG